MRLLLWTILLCLGLVACQGISPTPAVDDLTPAPRETGTPRLTLIEPTIIINPTPASIEVRVWGPLEFSPSAPNEVADIVDTQRRTFEANTPNIIIAYEPKADGGLAGLQEYLRSASAVAPAILPDIVIFPASQLNELAESQLLVPLDGLIDPALQEDLFPFAMRDTRVGVDWLAIPLSIEVEHGVTRTDVTAQLPDTLDDMVADDGPRWLFAGQGMSNGEVSDTFLVQWLSLENKMPRPNELPNRDATTTLLTALQAAIGAGTIPRSVLSVNDDNALFTRLLNRQADFIETNSRSFLAAQADNERLEAVMLPSLVGTPASVADGYLIGITTSNPTRQQAATAYVQWLLDPANLAEWNRITYGLPARRSALEVTVDDDDYRLLLATLLENTWLRPTDDEWRDFARSVQEQFRAVLQSQITPDDFADTFYP